MAPTCWRRQSCLCALALRGLPLAPSHRWQDSLDRIGPNTNLLVDLQSAYGQGGNWPAGRSRDLEDRVILPAIADDAGADLPQLWRALGVTDVVGGSSQSHLAAVSGLSRTVSAGPWVLYRLGDPQPRTWASCGAVAESSGAADLRAVLS